MSDTTVTRAATLIWPFLGWAVVGAGACFTVIAALSIGVFFVPAVAVALFAMLRWTRGRTTTMAGLIAGPAPVLLYVAYINRGGPGTVCSAIPGGEQCVEQMNPWPWFATGVALLAIGIAAFAWLRQGAGQ